MTAEVEAVPGLDPLEVAYDLPAAVDAPDEQVEGEKDPATLCETEYARWRSLVGGFVPLDRSVSPVAAWSKRPG